MDNLKYDEIELQPYLMSSEIYPDSAKYIFKWRTRMVNFKVNFKNGNDNISCPLGCNDDNTQDLFLNCPMILKNVPNIKTPGLKYSDIFSRNIWKIKVIGEILQRVFQV